MVNGSVSLNFEQIRMTQGNRQCGEAFCAAYAQNQQQAMNAVNDPSVSFPSLFTLLPHLQERQLLSQLQEPQATTAAIVGQILAKQEDPAQPQQPHATTVGQILAKPEKPAHNPLAGRQEQAHAALTWMLQTGGEEDQPSAEYRQVMDIVACVLLDTYQDESAMPQVLSMIFQRHQYGYHIHALVWAYFRIASPAALRLLAEYLLSPRRSEAELACKLLGVKADWPRLQQNRQQIYNDYLNWLAENEDYLYFTEESLQYSSQPKICALDHERKYLHKANQNYRHQPLKPDNQQEMKLLQSFQKLAHQEQKLLSAYSHKKWRENRDSWQQWLHSPLTEQLQTARSEMEGWQ